MKTSACSKTPLRKAAIFVPRLKLLRVSNSEMEWATDRQRPKCNARLQATPSIRNMSFSASSLPDSQQPICSSKQYTTSQACPFSYLLLLTTRFAASLRHKTTGPASMHNPYLFHTVATNRNRQSQLKVDKII